MAALHNPSPHPTRRPPSPSSTANAVRDCADGIGSELLTVSDRDLAPLLADAPAEVRMPDTLSLVPLKVSLKKDAACSPTFPSSRSPPPLLPPSYWGPGRRQRPGSRRTLSGPPGVAGPRPRLTEFQSESRPPCCC